jgi:receptor protein-tyrosine kinase
MSVQLRRKLQEADVMVNIEKGQNNKPLAAVDRVDSARLVGASSWQVLGLAVILGLVLGVLLALLLEHLDDTVRSELVARRASGLPVINKLPLFAGEPGKRFISAGEPRSDVAEIFKVFHNHVRYAAPNGPERCLLITSPERGEGKSYVAINLALSFALEGNRVCLLDADLRRSRMHECLDVLRPRGAVDAGLCGYLEGALAPEDVVLPTDNENLSVVLAGGRASNPPRALRSDRMRALLEQLVREYDVVIIDTPPVLPVVDAAILAALVRSALLVVRFGTTHLGDLAEASARLAHVNAPLAGMVINGVHGVMGSYVYNYRYRYHYRYHYSTGAGYGGYGGQ